MTAEILRLFPTPVVIDEIEGAEALNRELESAILEQRSRDTGLKLSNRGGWQSKRDFPRWAGDAGRRIVEHEARLPGKVRGLRTGGAMFRVVSTAIVTAILTSAFWIFAYNTGALGTADEHKLKPAGDLAVVDPPGGPPVAVAEGLEVGPAGLAIPVQGIKADQLTDTYTQARAGGARVHDAIDIMEHSFVLAIEKLMGLEIPLRAQYIRVLMAELTRIDRKSVV